MFAIYGRWVRERSAGTPGRPRPITSAAREVGLTGHGGGGLVHSPSPPSSSSRRSWVPGRALPGRRAVASSASTWAGSCPSPGHLARPAPCSGPPCRAARSPACSWPVHRQARPKKQHVQLWIPSPPRWSSSCPAWRRGQPARPELGQGAAVQTQQWGTSTCPSSSRCCSPGPVRMGVHLARQYVSRA